MIRLLISLSISLSFALAATAQDQLPPDLLNDQTGFGSNPFQLEGAELTSPEVSAQLVPVDATSVDIKVTVNLPAHYYIYSMTSPSGMPTKIEFDLQGFEFASQPVADRKPKIETEFGETMEKFYDTVTWTRRLRSKTGPIQPGQKVTGELSGQYCGDGKCMLIRPPLTFTAALPQNFVAAGPAASVSPAPTASGATQVIVPEMAIPRGATQVPIRFAVSLSPTNPGIGEYVTLTITADIDEPFHTYSTTQDPTIPGGTPTEIQIEKANGAAATTRSFSVEPAPQKKPGVKPGEVLEVHHGRVQWVQEYVVSDPNVVISGAILFQICDESSCQPPATAPFLVRLNGSAEAAALAAAVPDQLLPEDEKFGTDAAKAGLVPFIISAIGAGFIALLTPCVFPMIPVTVSYFVKQGEHNPGSTLKLAVMYCLSIVAAFTGLGLLVSVTLGPAVLNQVANNPWLNLFFAFVFTGFALMLLGMFDIQMPSWLMTWTSKKQETGGIIGVIFMALTFTLVSFTCTFAFVGNVLVLAANGGGFLRPIIGMAAFSAAFSSPFFLLAMFPSFLKKMPKSGGWMNRVKVTLGLLELAIVTKFLSVADIGFSPTGMPQYLDYHLVMGSWIAVAIITSLYLLSVFRMPHDTPSDTVGPLSAMFSLGFMGMAAYIAVGLFSAKSPEGVLWQQIVAFAPPLLDVSQGADGEYVSEHNGLEYQLDFDVAVKKASESNKPMFLDFTGVNCINCRRMEHGVLSSASVHDVLDDLVRAQLYVDTVPGVNSDPEEHQRLLNRNIDLQENWLRDTSLPSYVIATPDGKEILSVFSGLDTTGVEFQKFLETGLQKWQQRVQNAATQTQGPETAVMNTSFMAHDFE